MIPRFTAPDGYSISRVIKGGWHLAGGHGAIDPAEALRDMAMFVDAGITTFDCADIYTGVEALIGRFRREYPAHARQLQVHTKFVPDLPDLATLDGRRVEAVIDRSLARLGMEQLDLVQFHWWDFGIPRHVEIAQELNRLRRAGKIARIGVTNFDVPRLAELCAAGIPVAFHQLQYSLLDDRPRHGMTDYCRSQGIALLCYGTVCGGFLSERWLGQPPPVDPSNRSLIKYRLIIEEFGGWELFQELLRALARVAGPGGDIASVASRAILDRDTVAAVIIGAVDASHVASHARLHALRLTREELSMLAAIADRRLGPLGDVYELERDRTGPHGRIMKYDLNALP